jgi:hypothetical protein
MSNGRDPYPPYRYAGDYRYSKDLTDEAQFEMLQPRIGDVDPRRAGTDTPWGKVHQLTQESPRFTFVSTDILDRPAPWAMQLRFSLDGVTFTPEVPATYPAARGIEFTITRSVDQKSGQFTESFELFAGDAQPFCSVIARALTISARLTSDSTNFTPLYVQAVVCIVSNIDCEAVAPPVAPVPGFVNTAIARFPAQTAAATLILPDPTRALFSISNQSAANLYVALAGVVNITPGTEFATVVLPPNVGAGYEVLNYRGAIAFQFDADDASGYAIKTEGLYS